MSTPNSIPPPRTIWNVLIPIHRNNKPHSMTHKTAFTKKNNTSFHIPSLQFHRSASCNTARTTSTFRRCARQSAVVDANVSNEMQLQHLPLAFSAVLAYGTNAFQRSRPPPLYRPPQSRWVPRSPPINQHHFSFSGSCVCCRLPVDDAQVIPSTIRRMNCICNLLLASPQHACCSADVAFPFALPQRQMSLPT